nr:MAG TPA: hypothetical protein [Caudoviricetes sp.]
MRRIEKHLRAQVLQEKISKCVERMIKYENEMASLGFSDVFSEDANHTQSLFQNLRWIQNGRITHSGNLGRYAESPCSAVVALLERTMLPKRQSGLQMRGCTILIQDNHVRFCISGEVDESIVEQIHECHRTHSHHNKKQCKDI